MYEIDLRGGSVPQIQEEVVITPSTEVQYAVPQMPYNTFAKVTVNAVDPSAYINNQTKTVDSSTVSQTVEPDSGYTGLDSVTVNPYVLDTKTVDPSTSVQTVNSSADGMSSVTVNAVTSSIDSNIQASNIKLGVSILGVSGTYEGSNITPVEPPENDVIFIDYNGKIMYSYSKDEFLALNAMPQNPEHTGLVSDGWNWTLADAQDYVEDYDRLVIGQLYHTDDGTTRIHITLDEETEIMLRFFLIDGDGNDGTTIVYWGDGTQTAVTNNNTSKVTTKTLPAGNHVIEIKVRPELTYMLTRDYGDYSRNLIFDSTGSTPMSYVITGIETSQNCVGMYSQSRGFNNLAYITTHGNFGIGSTFQNAYNLTGYVFGTAENYWTRYAFRNSGIKYVSFCNSLKNPDGEVCVSMFSNTPVRIVTFPTDIAITSSGSSWRPSFYGAFENCTRLQYANIFMIDMNDYVFSGCTSLKAIHAGWNTAPSIGSNTFKDVSKSVKIHIPCGTALSYLTTWGEVGQYQYPEGCTEPFPDPTTPYMTTDGGVFFDTGVLVKPGVTFEFYGTDKDTGGKIIHGTHGAESGGVDSVQMRLFRYTSSLYTDFSYNERISIYTGIWSDVNLVKWFASTDGHMDVTYNGNHVAGTRTANTNTSTLPIAIFGAYSDSTTKEYADSGNILYYVRIWENGVVTKHYVPAKDANDVVCLHELIGDTYLYNTGTGTPTIDYSYKEITYDESLPW